MRSEGETWKTAVGVLEARLQTCWPPRAPWGNKAVRRGRLKYISLRARSSAGQRRGFSCETRQAALIYSSWRSCPRLSPSSEGKDLPIAVSNGSKDKRLAKKKVIQPIQMNSLKHFKDDVVTICFQSTWFISWAQHRHVLCHIVQKTKKPHP